MAAKSAGYRKPTGAEQRAIREQLAQAAVDPAVEAHSKEQSFLRAAQTAQDDLIWLINNEAWSALGFDTFADWWDARVSPVLDELPMLRPTREVAQLVIDRVRAEDEARPKSQRRTSKQLAAMVGLSAPTVRRSSSRSLPRSGDAESDLEETPPVIDVEPTNVTDEPTTEPAPADVPDAMTQAITEVAGSVGAGVRLPAEFLRDALCGSPVDPTHCDACGTSISWPDQTGGHLRCLTCDPSSDHKAIPNGPDWLPECSYCATQTSAAVTAGNTEDASPALGEPDVDELAASTSGTPSPDEGGAHGGLTQDSGENSSDGEDAQPRVDAPVGSEPVDTGLGSGELEERIEEEAASFSAPPLLPGATPEDSPAADPIEPSHAGVPAAGVQEQERIEVMSTEEFDAAVRRQLAVLHLTREQLAVMAQRDDFPSLAAKKLWLASKDSPAADLDDASQGAHQQSGPDSPTSREGDRSETDEEFDERMRRINEGMVADLDAVIDTEAGLSAITGHHLHGDEGGVAPESGTPTEGGIGADHSVEPVLEDGGEMPPELPSSSDPLPFVFDGADPYLVVEFFAFIENHLDRIDVDVIAPLLLDEHIQKAHQVADQMARIAGLLEHWRTK